MTEGKNHHDLRPQADGTYVIEFRTANFRRCRLHAQAMAAAQRSDCRRTGASISGVMCGVSRRVERNGRPSMLEASSALGFVCLALVQRGRAALRGGPT